MDISKVIEILDGFESQAIRDVNLDKELDIDNYESVGKLRLIRKIHKQVVRSMPTDGRDAA